MDPSTPLTVGVDTLITSAITGTLAGAYGLFRGSSQIGPLAAASALNGGIAGATFFSFREYIARPVLLQALADTHYSRQIRELQDRRKEGRHPGERLTWWDMRVYKVPDTAMSGAFTGGVLNVWKRGRPGILPGVVTAGIACTTLQLLYNELGIARIKYVSRELASPRAPALTTQEPQSVVMPLAGQVELEAPQSMMERVFAALGWHKVSDEEYLEKLRLKREMYLHRIAELEKGIEEERQRSRESSQKP